MSVIASDPIVVATDPIEIPTDPIEIPKDIAEHSQPPSSTATEEPDDVLNTTESVKENVDPLVPVVMKKDADVTDNRSIHPSIHVDTLPSPPQLETNEVVEPGADEDAPQPKLLLPRPYLEIEAANSPDTSELCERLSLLSIQSSPVSMRSEDSSAEFYRPEQTVIIFDWDDTLCPSTTCMRCHGLSVLGARPTGEVAEALEILAEEVRLTLEQASTVAEKVVIVTNAEEGWVDLSCKAWLPSLQNTLANCEVLSARSTWEPRGISSPAGWKARTFENVIENFYSRYESQSWKNILSIGDAPHEREALNRVTIEQRGSVPQGKRCRAKSIKFVLRPTIEQLIRELQVLRENLQAIIWHDDDLDISFSQETFQENSRR